MRHGGIEKRVFMHYKSLKSISNREWVWTKRCGMLNICPSDPFFAHGHGYYKLTTPNHVWLHLARTHKMPVRRVKDIVSAARGK